MVVLEHYRRDGNNKAGLFRFFARKLFFIFFFFFVFVTSSWISSATVCIHFNMQLLHYTSLAFSLLSCFESLAVAAPLQTYRNDSYTIRPQTTNAPPPGKLISSWKVTSVLQLWDTKKVTHAMLPYSATMNNS